MVKGQDSLMYKDCDFSKVLYPFIYGLIITLIITNILKHTLKVERPKTYKGGRDRYSFPSGHSSTVTFIFLFIFLSSHSIFTLSLLLFMWYKVAYGSYSDGYHRIYEVISGTIIGGTVALIVTGMKN
jgi:membrane-associated phospholipid phosphatase